MRRHLSLVPFLLLLAACGSQTAGTPSAPAPGASTTAPAAAPTTGPADPAATATAPTATATATVSPAATVSGPQYAFINKIDPASRELTYDLVEYFVGEAAVQACADDGEKPAENDWCVGYYIRNNNPKLRTVKFAPGAAIRVVDLGELKKADLGRLEGGMLLRFRIEGGSITEADQVYLS
ncbi:hypothetical protein [Actinoplanes xinjiangensis]|uniref:hypothetical protein n=1 Tax=Actinoplanes xinjiangensis TaxID=512350 RepID=UPI00341C3A75